MKEESGGEVKEALLEGLRGPFFVLEMEAVN
jgi:hypothetical protein